MTTIVVSFLLFLLRLLLIIPRKVECCNPLLLSCFWLPPATRLALQQEESLQRDSQTFTKKNLGSVADVVLLEWEPSVCEGFQVANCLFEKIHQGPPVLSKDIDSTLECNANHGVMIGLPQYHADEKTKRLQKLVEIINVNSEKLGYVQAICSIWPSSPCTMVKLLWDPRVIKSKNNKDETLLSHGVHVEEAVAKTRDWVENTLCRLRLCPNTASMERAAVGLDVASVSEGPIGIRHSLFQGRDDKSVFIPTATPAAALAAAFWKGVCELADRPEREIATLLIIAPPCYDDDFVAFYQICDELLEPSAQAVRAQDLVGRAWFHPQYQAALVGHSTILPGHALPASMVQTFVDKYFYVDQGKTTGGASTVPPNNGVGLEAIAKANDMVRWTPHATINLLRRSQLTAAKQVEATLSNPRPNYIYARNVVRIIQDQIKAIH